MVTPEINLSLCLIFCWEYPGLSLLNINEEQGFFLWGAFIVEMLKYLLKLTLCKQQTQPLVYSAGHGRVRKCSGDFPAWTDLVLTLGYLGGMRIDWREPRLTSAGQAGPARSRGTTKPLQCTMCLEPWACTRTGSVGSPPLSASQGGQRLTKTSELGRVVLYLSQMSVLLISVSFFTLMIFPFWKLL